MIHRRAIASLFAALLAAAGCGATEPEARMPPAVTQALQTELPPSSDMDACRRRADPCLRVVLDNVMPDGFILTSARFELDGRPLSAQPAIADVAEPSMQTRQIALFAGTVRPGAHEIQVLLQHRGHGHGVFSYVKKYKFDVTRKHDFSVAAGESLELRVVAYDKGGPTTPLEKRPAVLFEERRQGSRPR
jgi:hypothetical protein